MTLAELRTQVRFNIKRSSNGFSDDLIDQRVIWAVEAITLAHTWEEMRQIYSFTLDTGGTLATNTYSFPTGMKDIFSLRVETGSGRTLVYYHPRRFDIEYPKPGLLGTGDPLRYVDYGDTYMIHPYSSTAYPAYLRCSVHPTAMVVGTDAGTPGLNNKDKLITSLSTVYCFQSMQEGEHANDWTKTSASEFNLALKGDHSAEDWIPVVRTPSSGLYGVVEGNGYDQPHVPR